MRWLVASALAVHGVAHVVGFAVAWQLVSSPEVPYKTTVIGGIVELGDTGIRMLGVFWLFVATGFVASAIAVAAGWPSAQSWSLASLAASLVLCAITLPEARIGLVFSLLLVLAIALGPRAGLDVFRDGSSTSSPDGVLR